MLLQEDILINETQSIKDALKKIDKAESKVLLVVDEDNKLLGTVTDGDVRRYILSGKGVKGSVREVCNKQPIYIKKKEFSIEFAKKMLIQTKVKLIPIVDNNSKVVDAIADKQVFSESELSAFMVSKIDLPVVIMAGGKSTRLEPFSKIFPKPLIPIGDKPIIEIIIDRFKEQGAREYYVTLNYKGEMIKAYLDNMDKDYEIKYIWESDYFGTAGSLKLLEEEISDTFIVSNCDVIVQTNFEEVINFHKSQKASLTVLSSIQHYKIPFGIVEFEDGGKVTDIIEKPEYTFTINAGVYVLNKECLRFIPEKTYFDMTTLISTLVKNKKMVVTYPVNENDYIDIGQWEEYKKAIEKLHIFL